MNNGMFMLPYTSNTILLYFWLSFASLLYFLVLLANLPNKFVSVVFRYFYMFYIGSGYYSLS